MDFFDRHFWFNERLTKNLFDQVDSSAHIIPNLIGFIKNDLVLC